MLQKFMQSKWQREKVQAKIENALNALSWYKSPDVVTRKVEECWDLMEEYNKLTAIMQQCADTLNPMRTKQGLMPLIFINSLYEIDR